MACSPGPGTTPAKISIGAQATADLFPGGLYIILHKKAPTEAEELGEFRRVLDTTLEIELENGEWEFGAIGWEGSTNMGGKPKCFMSDSIILDGNDVAINLDVSYGGCRNNPFFAEGMHGADGAPNTTQIISCAGLDALDKTKNTINAGSDYCVSHQGAFKSFQIVGHDFSLGPVHDLLNRKSNPFLSKCLTGGGFNYTNLNEIYLPLFENIPQTIRAYESTNCSGNSQDLTFKGLKDADVDHAPGFVVNAGTTNFLYLNSTLCTPAKIAESTPSLGSGTEADPYIICGVNQLQAFDDSASYSSASYILARDLELGQNHNGYSLSTGTPFQGKFDGKNHYIKGLTTPLFNWVTGSADIRNLVLKDASFTTSSESMLGALAAKIYDSSGFMNFENIHIKNFSISLDSSVVNAYVGGLVGYIDSTGTNILNMSKIRISNGSIILDGDSVSGLAYLGGLAGYSNFDTENASNFMDIQVESVDLINTKLTTNHATGGLLGYAYKTNISFSTVTDSTIEGYSYIGGIIGRGAFLKLNAVAFTSTNTEDIQSKFICNNPSDDINSVSYSGMYSTSIICNRFGGIAGAITDSSVIQQSMAIFKIEDSDKTVSYLGGLVGYLNSSSAINSLTSNGVYLDVTSNGWLHGGLVGLTADSTLSNISHNVVIGKLHAKDTTQDTSQFIGGLVGKSTGSATFQMNTIDHMSIKGGNNLGFAAGYNDSFIIEFSALNSTLFADTNTYGISNTVGGFVGKNDSAGIVRNSLLYNSNISTNKSVCTQGASAGCGIIAGSNLNSSAKTFDLVKIESSDIFNNAGSSLNSMIGGNVNDNTTNTSIFSSASNYSGSSSQGIIINENTFVSTYLSTEPWEINGDLGYIPTYLDKHLTFEGINPENGALRFGNFFSPLLITSAENWNKIQTDAYLMNKSLALANDIEFSGKDFYPIGTNWDGVDILCGTVTFNGNLLASSPDKNISYKLKGITLDGSDFNAPSCSSKKLGIVSSLGDVAGKYTAMIGMSSNPIIIDNFNYTNSTLALSDFGVATGYANRSMISAHVLNATITDSATTGTLGGIVGKANLNSHFLINNKFTGSLTTSASNVGGLLGQVYDTSNFGLSVISYNFIKPTTLQKTTNIYLGGLISHYNSTTTSSLFSMEHNIVDLSEATFQTSSGYGAGFIANATSPINTVKNNLVYIGPSQLSGHSASKSFAYTAAGSATENYVIGMSSDSSPGVASGNFFSTEEDFLNVYSLEMFRYKSN